MKRNPNCPECDENGLVLVCTACRTYQCWRNEPTDIKCPEYLTAGTELAECPYCAQCDPYNTNLKKVDLSEREMLERSEAFFAQAFCIDGRAKAYVSHNIVTKFKIDAVIEMTDSKRGTFYVAQVVLKK